MNRQEAIEYLNRDGNLRVPCSRYGFDTFSCSPVAYRLAEIIAEGDGDAITTDALDGAMGLVVNDHADVSSILTEHGATPDDYELAAYECDICGDPHAESSHGEPLIQRDLHARNLTESVSVFMDDAADLTGRDPSGRYTNPDLVKLAREWGELTADEQDEYAPEFLDDIDAILSDAGWYPVTISDQGAWLVYGRSHHGASSGAR